MTRGEIYRTAERVPERGDKPGFYVVGPEEGLPRVSSVRCDFLALMFKRELTTLVASLPPRKLAELNRALAVALELD